jgi:hypothetical protein
MRKGYKFSEKQLEERRKRQKGKWSKKARERHSIRMKARFAEKKKLNANQLIVKQAVERNGGVSLKSRLSKVVVEIESIMNQLG